MATHLLEQYLTNPPYVTLDVLTFFQRMRDFDLERRQRHRGRKQVRLMMGWGRRTDATLCACAEPFS